MNRFIALLLLVASIASAAAANTENHTGKPGFVVLTHPVTSSKLDVTWEARQPILLPFRESLSLDGQNRECVLFLGPGKYVVLCDVIDWANEQRTKTLHVITVDGDAPPVPPTPVPPDPVPPEPNPVPDLSEFATAVRKTAIETKLPKAPLIELGRGFEAVAAKMVATNAITSRLQARREIAKVNAGVLTADQIKQAAPLERVIDDYLETNKVNSKDEIVSAFREIGAGLLSLEAS